MHNYLPKSPVTRVPELIERSDGLWIFTGGDLDDHIRLWRDIDSKVNSAQWAMAAIAASLTTTYGENDIEKFAEAVSRSSQYIWKMARTYRRTIEKSLYSDNLSFSHHAEAIRHPEPAEALAVAQDQGLSSIGLGEWITEQARARATKPQRAAHKKRQDDLRDFLERVDGVILNDFMLSCPNADWGRRVFRGWRDDVAWELRRIGRSDITDQVSDAVAEGANTITDIKQATGLSVREIEGVVAGKVKEGEWDFVREGGEPDDARGSRRTIIHVRGAPCFA